MEGKTNRELQALLEMQEHKIKQLEQRITTLEWVICTVVDDSEPEPVSYTHLTLPTICSV